MNPFKTIVILWMAILVPLNSLFAQAVMLDQSFGTGGRVITDFGGFDVAFKLIVQPDNKILLCGSAAGNPEQAVVIRYLPDGALDPSFGIGGKSGIDFENAGNTAYALALQPDGKILITGETIDETPNQASSDIFLARFLPNGTLDANFGTGGKLRIANSGWNDEGLAIAVQPDGKILCTGHQDENNQSYMAVFRFDAQGNPDPTFGSNGKFVYPDAYTGVFITIAASGNFFITGQTLDGAFTPVLAFLNNGALDQDFGQNGISKLTLSPDDVVLEKAWCSYLNPDGTLTIGGNFDGFSTARLLPTGQLDPSYGVGGIAKASFPGNRYLLSQGSFCLPQSGGKTLVTGLLVDASNDDFGIARFDKTGRLDPSFGQNGWISTDITGTMDWCYGSAFQSGNKLVLGGYSIGNQKIDMLLARYALPMDSVPGDTLVIVQTDTQPVLYPNPSSGSLTLEYKTMVVSDIRIDLLDAAGRWVLRLMEEDAQAPGAQKLPLDISGITDGYYILRFVKRGEAFYFPLVKQQ